MFREILEKGETQVAGKEKGSQLSNQLKDIAAIVMQKTINPETQRMYTISMIEHLMHGIHFAVDAHGNSKKQEVIWRVPLRKGRSQSTISNVGTEINEVRAGIRSASIAVFAGAVPTVATSSSIRNVKKKNDDDFVASEFLMSTA
ncbi:ribosome maturation protein SBDS, partial [Tanacetum coccineum]